MLIEDTLQLEVEFGTSENGTGCASADGTERNRWDLRSPILTEQGSATAGFTGFVRHHCAGSRKIGIPTGQARPAGHYWWSALELPAAPT